MPVNDCISTVLAAPKRVLSGVCGVLVRNQALITIQAQHILIPDTVPAPTALTVPIALGKPKKPGARAHLLWVACALVQTAAVNP